ncbi:hypothetical protein S40288_11304 [Stachybotrys chartarum IBT 40288]|nr:hypothetical protein S40288_11304 [Stachybotrys chartarum IBT 40288]
MANPSASPEPEDKGPAIACEACGLLCLDYFEHCGEYCCPEPECSRHELQRPKGRLAETTDGKNEPYVIFESDGEPVCFIPPQFCTGDNWIEPPPQIKDDMELVFKMGHRNKKITYVLIVGREMTGGDWKRIETGTSPIFLHEARDAYHNPDQ